MNIIILFVNQTSGDGVMAALIKGNDHRGGGTRIMRVERNRASINKRRRESINRLTWRRI